MHTKVLFLEGVPAAERLARLFGPTASRADSPLQAAWALAEGDTEALIVGERTGWAHELLANLPMEHRPAVVAVGEVTPTLRGLVDRWVRCDCDEARIARDLATAVADTRHDAGAGSIDGETGLPSRRALFDAVVRKAARAQVANAELSAVVIQVKEAFPQAAALVATETRRSEITARVGVDHLATLIHGGRRASDRAWNRFEAHLRGIGIHAEGVSLLLPLREAAECLSKAIERSERARAIIASP